MPEASSMTVRHADVPPIIYKEMDVTINYRLHVMADISVTAIATALTDSIQGLRGYREWDDDDIDTRWRLANNAIVTVKSD